MERTQFIKTILGPALVLVTVLACVVPTPSVIPAATPDPTHTPMAVSTDTPTPTNTATPTPSPPLPTGRVEGTLLGTPGVTVTLCDGVLDTSPGKPIECSGGYQRSTTIDAASYFLFAAVPPGHYYVLFDIPEEMVAGMPPGSLCAPDDSFRRDPLPEGGGTREGCFDQDDLGPTVLVVADQTTTYVSR